MISALIGGFFIGWSVARYIDTYVVGIVVCLLLVSLWAAFCTALKLP